MTREMNSTYMERIPSRVSPKCKSKKPGLSASTGSVPSILESKDAS